jgi:hypothetical protein
MSQESSATEHSIGKITAGGKEYSVSLRVGYDGVEHIGRLQFAEASNPDVIYQDHGAIPGTTVAEATWKAKELSDKDLEHRLHRAMSERRRFGKLREATNDMIERIRDLNEVVINLQTGGRDRDEGNKEIEKIQGDLMKIVRSFRQHAGVEDE